MSTQPSFLARNNYNPSVIKPIENLHFSWRNIRPGPALFQAVVIALVALEPVEAVSNATLLLAFMLSFPVALVGVGWFTGLTGDRVQKTIQPNQGMRNSLRTGFQVGGVFGGLVWLSIFAGQIVLNDLTIALLQSTYVFVIVFFSFSFSLGFAPVIQHVVLRRLLMWQHQLPRDYAAFLNHASRLILLRRVGGVYIFPHRYLLEYFAALEPDKAERQSLTVPRN